MKKVISLVLALVLVLCAVSAFAEGSKGNEDLKEYLIERMTGAGTAATTGGGAATGGAATGGTAATAAEPTTVFEITPTGTAKELVDKVLAGGKDAKTTLNGLVPADVLANVKDGAVINEILPMQFKNNNGEAKQITFTFETPYAEGTKVTILIGIPGKTLADTEWIELVGTGNAAGSVVVTVSKELMTKLSNNPFIVIALG